MIRFTKYIWIYVMISALVLIPGVYSLVKNGVKPSVDFTGGSVLEIKTQNPIEQTSIDDAIKTQKIPVLSMQKQNGGTYLFRIGQVSEEQISKFIVALQAKSEEPMDILRNDT